MKSRRLSKTKKVKTRVSEKLEKSVIPTVKFQTIKNKIMAEHADVLKRLADR